MSEEQPTPQETDPRIFYVIGGVLLFIGLYISVFLIPDVIRAASGPDAMTLSEAAQVANSQQTYARIEDGTWACDTLSPVRVRRPAYSRYGSSSEETSWTEVFYTDESQDAVMLVVLSGEVNCADLDGDNPEGYLYAMDDGTRQDLTNDARLARYSDTETFLEMCGYCGRENSMIGAAFGVAFTLLGVASVLHGRRLKNT